MNPEATLYLPVADKNYYSLGAIALELRISRGRLAESIERGDGPPHILTNKGHVRVDVSDALIWLQRHDPWHHSFVTGIPVPKGTTFITY